jgi:hypothetical protein
VAARSKTWVCGRSLARIVGSNGARGRDVCSEYWWLWSSGLWHGPIPRLEESTECVCVSLSVVICNSNPTYNKYVADAKIRQKNNGSKPSFYFIRILIFFSPNLFSRKYLFFGVQKQPLNSRSLGKPNRKHCNVSILAQYWTRYKGNAVEFNSTLAP